MNKVILRNSKIIFDKKKEFRSRPGELFFQPAGSETDFFFTSATHLQWYIFL